jgi:hypothetical protein
VPKIALAPQWMALYYRAAEETILCAFLHHVRMFLCWAT